MENFLKTKSVFKSAEDEVIKQIVNSSKIVNFKKWELIIRNGSKDNNKIFIVKEWKIKYSLKTKAIDTINEGLFFWEIPFLTWEETHKWNFISESDTTLIKINKKIIEMLMNSPNLRDKMEDIIMKRIIKNKSL